MNEEKPNIQPEKTGLDEKRKTALLRYIAVLFALAFVMVLLSFFSQLRNSRAEISQLNESSSNALIKAEQLQQTNEELRVKNQELTKQIAYLEGQLESMQAQLVAAEEEKETLEDEKVDLLLAYQDEENITRHITNAYENLLTAMTQEDNAASLKNLANQKEYLGSKALEIYENLLKEGE